MRLSLLLLLLWAPRAYAQESVQGAWCGTDLRSDETWDNLARFASDRASGALDAFRIARKGAETHVLGERRSFNVLESGWAPREFELRDETAEYRLWVAVADLGSVTDPEIAGLQDAMLRATPGGSVDPARGILANNRTVFGDMPDFDGDGILDILMYDMKAGDGVGTVILGYVSSTDLLLSAGSGVGNKRDVLYLDAAEGSNNLATLASVASHELTHLIHYNYLGQRLAGVFYPNRYFEDTFIMEGLAEYSMVANGYSTRGASYLGDPLELSVPLFDWRDGAGPGARDYQRASLFFSYLGQRLGPAQAGSILRGPALTGFTGTTGLGDILTANGLTLASVIADFHTANRFNDRSLDPAFGYEAPSRSSVLSGPTRVFGPAGQASGSVSLYGGAVEYYSFSGVASFDLDFDTPTAVPEVREILRRRIRGRIVMESYDGSRTWENLAPIDEPYQFFGPFRSVQLVLANVTGTVDTPSAYAFKASWTAVPAGTATESPEQPTDGLRLGANFPNPFSGSTSVPFVLQVPGEVRLSVFDLLGRRVATPLDRFLPAGNHVETVSFDRLAPGAYLLVLESGRARVSRPIAVTR